MAFKVWIDQDLCTGDGLCEEIYPAIFQGHDDGLYYVKEPEWADLHVGPDGPEYQMAKGMASVPDKDIALVVEAAEECPGECIFVEQVD
jgi:ferredoxin